MSVPDVQAATRSSARSAAGPDLRSASAPPLPWLDAAALRRLVPPGAATDALEQALRDGLDPAGGPPRSVIDVAAGQLLLMPAATAAGVGVKVAAVAPDNPARGLARIQGLYLLLDPETLVPRALLDGVELTSIRTPAVSALAVRHLAGPGGRLVVFGTGPQGWGHVEAIAADRELTDVAVIGRDPERLRHLLHRCQAAGLPARQGGANDVARADIVVAATTARVPLFDASLVQPGACVVAVGSHEPEARELDGRLLGRATVVVEDVSTAMREAGDVILACAEGQLVPEQLVDVRSLVTSGVPRDERPRVFKSVGMAWQDLVVAQAAVAADRMTRRAEGVR